MRNFGITVIAILAVAGGGCGAGAGAGASSDELAELAAKAEAEFSARGEGSFVDTGYASYCRTGTGFDEGVFKQIGFAPSGDGFQYCYNVGSNLKKVALSATAMRDGSVRCLIVDATSGEPSRGDITDQEPCVP